MERDELRAIQAPPKQRYQREPESAVVTLKADGELGEGISCSVQTGRALAEAGLHPAFVRSLERIILCPSDHWCA